MTGFVMLCCMLTLCCGFQQEDSAAVNGAGDKSMKKEHKRYLPVDAGAIRLSIIYDNRVYGEGFESAWGFSCMISGAEDTILFDTGGDGKILMKNMERLNIDPRSVDGIVISHFHWDHTGGLGAFLEKNSDVTIFAPGSFAGELKKGFEESGPEVIAVGDPIEICGGIYSTGELGRSIKEQALVVYTDRGLIVLTGCAHPGIVEIIEKARSIIDKDVLLVIGGFHLLDAGERELQGIISRCRALKVHTSAPCHCSGDAAIRLFEKEYGENFIRVGAGRILTF